MADSPAPFLLALCVAMLIAGTGLAGAPAEDGLVVANAIPVRSIDLDSPDFGDLEPLVSLVGSARVVALGEGSHGAGTDFSAKARLIRFLHERMGFDVLLWENGIYDTRRLDRSLGAGLDPREAAAELYAHWANADEVVRLLGYVEREKRAGRRLDIAGFDLQISSPFRTTVPLVDDLLEFFATPSGSLLTEEILGRLSSVRERAGVVSELAVAKAPEEVPADRFAPVQKDLASLAGPMIETLDRSSDRLRRAHSPREMAYVRQMLQSLAGIAEIDEPLPGDPERSLSDFVRRWNQREIVNAANIAWFASEYFSDRRIVVWAHNAHLASVFLTPDFRHASTTPPEGLAIRPSGPQIRRALGDELFTILFTADHGSVRQVEDALSLQSQLVDISPAPAGSIEARLHDAGLRFAVLPLGAATGDLAAWLATPRSARIDLEYLGEVALTWRDVADALFFTDRVRPSGGPFVESDR